MALIRCPSCDREISAKAAACVGCGEPYPAISVMRQFAEQHRHKTLAATILSIVDFGAYARLDGYGYDGLIHISRITGARLEHPQEVLQVGQNVRVFVSGADLRGNLQFSMTPVA